MLGYLWTLVRPLLLFGVLWVFFTQIGQVNDRAQPGMEYYGSQLLGSIVLFTFFAEATAGAVQSMVDRENLLRKIHFPRLVIPASVVLLAMFNLALNLIVVLIFALIAGVEPMLSWLELPLIVGGLVLLSARAWRCCSPRCSSGSATSSRSGKSSSQILFYASPVIISIADRQRKARHDRACTCTCSTRSR